MDTVNISQKILIMLMTDSINHITSQNLHTPVVCAVIQKKPLSLLRFKVVKASLHDNLVIV